MKRVWINPLYDIYVCPEKNVCFCNLTINKKKSQEVAKLKGRCLRCIGVYSATGERLLVFITNIQLDKILVARSTKDYDSRTLL